MSYSPPRYSVLNQTSEDNRQVHAIEFLDGQYEGLVFSYGKVELIEDDVSDELRVKFEYDIHHAIENTDESELIPYLGDFLVFLITSQLDSNELIYAGGTDTQRPMRDE